MDYIERLLRRALAQPREAVPGLFDPFEQVAPWALEASASPRPAEPAVSPTLPREDVRLPPAPAPAGSMSATAVHAPLPPVVPPAPATPGTPAAALEPAKPLPRPPDVAATVRAPFDAAPQGLTAHPLAHADAFMRTLGVQPAPSEAAPVHAPRPAPPALPPVLGAPPAIEPSRPALPQVQALPPKPPPPPQSAPAPQPPQVTAAAPHDAGPPAARPAPGAPAAAQRMVQTTVVLAPPTRRLDDLAHSSGISRFGIGQG